MPSHAPPAWASLVLATTGATGLRSQEVVQSLWSGYGQIVRCHLEGGDRDSVIVKHVQWPTSHDHPRGWNSNLSHERKVRSYEVESAWYQRHAALCTPASRVPQCLAVHTRGDEVFLVLEDLNQAGFAGRRNTVTNTELRACLSWLANFHATFMGHEPDGLWTTGTYWHLATRPDELEVLGDSALARAASAIDQRLSESPFQTFVHGDAKLANFCFGDRGGPVAAVDFQYVGGGCGMKDVAYFMSSCLDEDQCETREGELLDLYFGLLRAALANANASVDGPELERDWRALYPWAWTDFSRFLKGWSPGHWKLHRYSRRMEQDVLAALCA